MPEIEVKLATTQYQVHIAKGALKQLGQLVTNVWQPSKVAVVTDTNVGPHYADQVVAELKASGFQPVVLTIPAGETSKAWSQVEQLTAKLAELQFSRVDGVLALGGGVVGDLAGFVASIYMRGIHFIQVPTSLLAQVDSSVGGKTAIDLPAGKNLVGSFYQPDLVVIDPETLQTLPTRMLVEGYGEILKCAAMVGGNDWQLIQKINQPADILANALALIENSVQFKAQVVMADEKEGHQRQLLNFGHTLGHAVELTRHGKLMHGEAVAIGTAHICQAFEAHGLTAAGTTAQIVERLRAVGLPVDSDQLGTDAFYTAIGHDKKVRDGQLTLIYVEKIGQPQFYPIPLTELRAWLTPHLQLTV